MYYKTMDDNFILGVGMGRSGIQIEQAEYQEIMTVIQNKPTPPEGYIYRLKTDLTWELHDAPPIPEVDEPAEEADYLAALERFGVQ